MRFLLAMYGARLNEVSIDTLRYYCFAKSTRLNEAVKLSTFPPTSSAARPHLYRVYYQVQVLLGNALNPADWGWIMRNYILEPIPTLLPPAPDTARCNFLQLRQRLWTKLWLQENWLALFSSVWLLSWLVLSQCT